MKKRVLFLIACIYASSVHAQHWSVWASYNSMNAPQWDRIIQSYNFSRPWFSQSQPLLKNGYEFGASRSVNLNHWLRTEPLISYRRIISTSDNNGKEYMVALRFFNAEAILKAYPFNVRKYRPSESFVKNLSVSAGPGFSVFTPMIRYDGDAYEKEEGEKYRPISLGVNFNLGLAYDFTLNSHLLLSPFYRLSWYPSVSISDFSQAVQGSNITSLENKSAIFMNKFGLQLSYKSR